MIPSLGDVRVNTRLMAHTAAALYGAAAVDGLIDRLTGGAHFSLAPTLVALAIALLLIAVGPRLPRHVLFAFGPLGTALVATALATAPTIGDSEVLYVLPVLWTVFFFGLPGAVAIVCAAAAADGLALNSLHGAGGGLDAWVDVMVSVTAVAAVVEVLARRNSVLLARLAGEARTDTLTGLLNRRGFDERAAVELAHARREGHAIAIASLDIDYFKRVNDEWGHETGDRVLAYVGAVLGAHSRDVDVVARTGGEEFVVLLPGSDSANAERFTQRIHEALGAAEGSALPTVRVSAGVTSAVAPANIQGLLHRADLALYTAKRTGRNRTVIDDWDESQPVRGADAGVSTGGSSPQPVS